MEVESEVKPVVGSNFYRYETVEYAVIGFDGDFESPTIPNPKVVIRVFNLWRETPKGYWIGFGELKLGSLRSNGVWVSKTSIKKYAYSTKKEALQNFIKRNEKRIRILKNQTKYCEIVISIAKK